MRLHLRGVVELVAWRSWRLKLVSSRSKLRRPEGPGAYGLSQKWCMLPRLTWFHSVLSPQGRQEKVQLQEEYDTSLKEAKITEMLKREEREIQQECEKCPQVGRRNLALGTHTPCGGYQEIPKSAQQRALSLLWSYSSLHIHMLIYKSILLTVHVNKIPINELRKCLKAIPCLDFRGYLRRYWFKKIRF